MISFLQQLLASLSALIVFSSTYILILYLLPLIGLDKRSEIVIIASLSIACMLVLSAFRLMKRSELDKRNLIAMLLYFGFILYVLASVVFIGERLGDNSTTKSLIFMNSFLIAIAAFIRNHKKEMLLTTAILSFSYLLLLAFALASGGYGRIRAWDFSVMFPKIGDGLSLYQNVSLYLGVFCVIMLPGMARQHWSRFAAYAGFALGAAGLLLVSGRAYIVSLAVAAAAHARHSWLVGNRRHKAAFFFWAFLLLVVFLLAGVWYWNTIHHFLTNSRAVLRFRALLSNDDSSDRIFLFRSAWSLFTQNASTLLFGLGINGFQVFINEYDGGMYPHNIILELLCEYGIVGFSLFMAPIVYILSVRRQVLGSFYGSFDEEGVSFLLFIFFWTAAMFSGGLGNSGVIIFFSFMLLPAARTAVPRGRAKTEARD